MLKDQKSIIFFKNIYIMPLYCHVDQGNLWYMIYRNVEEVQKKSFNLIN
jgi:hypothetical protein